MKDMRISINCRFTFIVSHYNERLATSSIQLTWKIGQQERNITGQERNVSRNINIKKRQLTQSTVANAQPLTV